MNIVELSNKYEDFPLQGLFSEWQDRKVSCDFSGSWMLQLW